MGKTDKEAYKAIFTYTDEVLGDFEAMYIHKTSVSPAMRLVLALVGLAGVALFAALMVTKGFSVGFLVPLVLFALILLLALLLGRKKADSSVQRYRKHYLDKRAHFLIDSSGVELKLNGQKAYARSKFKDIYSLIETDRTFYFEIKGRAFYILPKDSIDGSTDDLRAYVQRRCGKRFQQIDVSKSAG